MENILHKSCRENSNTHFMFDNSPHPPKKILAVYEAMGKNTVQPGRPQMTI